MSQEDPIPVLKPDNFLLPFAESSVSDMLVVTNRYHHSLASRGMYLYTPAYLQCISMIVEYKSIAGPVSLHRVIDLFTALEPMPLDQRSKVELIKYELLSIWKDVAASRMGYMNAFYQMVSSYFLQYLHYISFGYEEQVG